MGGEAEGKTHGLYKQKIIISSKLPSGIVNPNDEPLYLQGLEAYM